MHHKRLILIALLVAVGAILGETAFAQEFGNATRGWKLAIRTCAAATGSTMPENLATWGRRPLVPSLLTSHRSIPNILLHARERADATLSAIPDMPLVLARL